MYSPCSVNWRSFYPIVSCTDVEVLSACSKSAKSLIHKKVFTVYDKASVSPQTQKNFISFNFLELPRSARFPYLIGKEIQMKSELLCRIKHISRILLLLYDWKETSVTASLLLYSNFLLA